MQWETYLDFLSADDIRIKGHRIGIDDVLLLYLDGYTSEEIAQHFPTLRLVEIYATITYYHEKRIEIDAYLARLNAWRQRVEEADDDTPDVVKRIQALKSQRQLERLQA